MAESMEYSMPKRVTIEKADNGYVVSCYTGSGEKKTVAKDITEASEAAEKMMGLSEKKEDYAEVKNKANKMALNKK